MFSSVARKVIYTNNAIELLKYIYRKINCLRSALPSDTALLKALYLSTLGAIKKDCNNTKLSTGLRGDEHHV